LSFDSIAFLLDNLKCDMGEERCFLTRLTIMA
jgi:hypothetical protein